MLYNLKMLINADFNDTLECCSNRFKEGKVGVGK